MKKEEVLITEFYRCIGGVKETGSGQPDAIAVPGYGWVLIDGQPTEAGKKLIEDLEKDCE